MRRGIRARSVRAAWFTGTRLTATPTIAMRGAQQAARIVACHPPSTNIVNAQLLDDLAVVHDGHALTKKTDDSEVMTDEDHRQLALPMQPVQQVENFRLNRYIER